MRTKHLTIFLALAVAASAATAGEEHKHCSSDLGGCLRALAEKLEGRGWIGIELDDPSEEGMPIVGVFAESPAETAGVRVGDILVAFNGVGIDEPEKMRGTYSGSGPGDTIVMTVKRDGKSMDFDIVMSKVPEEVIAQWIGQHFLYNHAGQKHAEHD